MSADSMSNTFSYIQTGAIFFSMRRRASQSTMAFSKPHDGREASAPGRGGAVASREPERRPSAHSGTKAGRKS